MKDILKLCNIFPSSYIFWPSIHRLFLTETIIFLYFLINLLLGILALRKINPCLLYNLFFFFNFYLYELMPYPFISPWVITSINIIDFFSQFFFWVSFENQSVRSEEKTVYESRWMWQTGPFKVKLCVMDVRTCWNAFAVRFVTISLCLRWSWKQRVWKSLFSTRPPAGVWWLARRPGPLGLARYLFWSTSNSSFRPSPRSILLKSFPSVLWKIPKCKTRFNFGLKHLSKILTSSLTQVALQTYRLLFGFSWWWSWDLDPFVSGVFWEAWITQAETG